MGQKVNSMKVEKWMQRKQCPNKEIITNWHGDYWLTSSDVPFKVRAIKCIFCEVTDRPFTYIVFQDSHTLEMFANLSLLILTL